MTSQHTISQARITYCGLKSNKGGRENKQFSSFKRQYLENGRRYVQRYNYD